MIHLIDYGVGNIQAFLNCFKRLGIDTTRADSVESLNGATHLILPGVGAFDNAMRLFNYSGLRDTVENLVLIEKIPVLGICVGMQMLATSSEEGNLVGLNWIPGTVRSFSSNPLSRSLPMPHMGWNDITVHHEHVLLNNIGLAPKFYFLHSYYYDCADKKHVAASTQYGFDFDCIVSNENIYGIQCHPEKSHSYGSLLLKNFSEI
ncbi:imidazole glycerol phosphate synthase subunit HisH [Yersinia intermedia]|uniref:imidazole glycerol phosphate synthase subunit HisH n=1 Tax=Yersinia intermedia TaxID=631 RepID=UPI0005E9790B|nr:imidazole glycerol phosphate synthase subunit HisH [Yersinia intermedia]CNI49815.1 imidazole glycerol phosphate synthase subunit HisH [Yersinia intermedia]